MMINTDHANNGGNIEEWSSRQAYIQLAYILLGAASLGVETTTMEGFSGEGVNKYLLDNGLINKDERATLIIGMGYVDAENKMTFVGEEQMRVEDDEYVKFH